MIRLLFYALSGTLIMVLSACASGEGRIANLLKDLPNPDGVTLVYSFTGQGQGSQDSCFATFFYGLYGTDKSYDEVAMFYEDQLIADNWKRVDLDWRPNNGLFFERVYLEKEVNVSNISEDTIKTAQTQYDTLYLVVITYRDWFARVNC
jgi:hypothetical protein